MALASFPVEDKLGRPRFFQKNFLLSDNSIKVVLEILFLIFSNSNLSLLWWELTQNFYPAAEALFIIKQVEHSEKKKFAKTALDKKSKRFVLYIVVVEDPLAEISIYSSRKIQIATFHHNNAPTKISAKNSNLSDVFSAKKYLVLVE